MTKTVLTAVRLTCLLLIFCFSLSSNSVLAQTKRIYVSDILVVTLREGPAKSYRTVKTVKSGEKLTVLSEEKKFIKVRTKDGTEGWILRQYTLQAAPKAVVIKSLNNEIERLSLANQKITEKADKLTLQLQERQQSFKELRKNIGTVKKKGESTIVTLTKELEDLQNKYTTLFENSRDAIKIREERDTMRTSFNALTANIETLEQANSKLSTQKNMYWFLSGGGVLLIGWLIGKMSSRRQSRPSLSL